MTHHSSLPDRPAVVYQHNCPCGHSQTRSALLKGKFFNTFDRGDTTQNFIPEIWHWSRGKEKKEQLDTMPSAQHFWPLTSTLFLQLNSIQPVEETSSALMGDSWDFGAKGPQYIGIAPPLRSVGSGLWLSVQSDSTWTVENRINWKLPDPNKKDVDNCKPILVNWYNTMLC